MPEKTPFHGPEFSCPKMFSSDSWPLQDILLCHHGHVQMNLTIRSAPGHVESAQCREFYPNKDSVKDLDTFPYFENVEHLADSESQQPPPPLPRTQTNPSSGALQSDNIAEPWPNDAQDCLETNLQNNPYYPFAMHKEYNHIQCRIKKNGMKTYYDNVLKEENTTLHFPRFKDGNAIQKIVASMPNDQTLR
jgi:hypothetical protein